MSFAILEARTNDAVMRRLANARGSLDGGADFPVIFDRGHVELAGGEISGNRPLATVLSTDVAACTPNTSTFSIGSANYTVRDAQPDGAGMTVLVLEVA